MVDPILANDPQHQENLTLSLSDNGAARAYKGCKMADRMDEQFQSPQPIQMVLISPPGEG